jgi:acylphosphatase
VSGPRAARLVITGVVQGVGYRAFVEREAKALRLAGTVRNLSDGSVEAIVHGEATAVEALITICRRGPIAAVVDDVRVTAHSGPAPIGFTVLPTR